MNQENLVTILVKLFQDTKIEWVRTIKPQSIITYNASGESIGDRISVRTGKKNR